MTDRLSVQQLDIPSSTALRRAAGQIAIDAVREAGLDPRKAIEIPMVREMAQMWARGEMTRAEFIADCRKVLILNPTLKEQR